MDRSLAPRVEIVTGLARLEELAGPWEALRARCPGATPFQSPAWLIPWWRAFAQGGLRAVALHGADRLAGMAPLYLASGDAGSPRWLLLGSGNTDHLDVLAEPGAEAELAEAVAEVLEREDADQADFLQLPPGSVLFQLPSVWRAERLAGDACPAILLSDTPGAGLDDIVPRKFAARLRQARRRLSAAGRADVESAEGEPVERAEALFGELVRLHAAAWQARGGPGVLTDRVVQRFHRDVVRAAHPLGLLDLRALRLNGRVVAAYYGFRDAGGAYYYLGGFDPDAGALSPGTLMVADAVEAAARRGAARFDFLRGREPYKYYWGAVDVPSFRLRLVVPARGPFTQEAALYCPNGLAKSRQN